MDKLYTIIEEHGKILLRSERYICRFKHFSPNNTTEISGLKKTFLASSQVYNYFELYSNDIPNANFDKTLKYDRNKFSKIEEFFDNNLQESIVDPNNHNLVKIFSNFS
jgi:hypothetical protein